MSRRIALISDIHLSRSHPYFHANWEILLEELHKAQPDLVLVAGDLALDGTNREDDLVFAREQLDRLSAPWLAVPGNHDVGNSLPDERGEATITDARQSAWERHFGKSWWAASVDGWTLIGLNCMLFGSGLAGEAEQLNFLRATVTAAKGAPIALLSHKPLCNKSLHEADIAQAYWYPHARAPLMDMLTNGAVRLVMSGHLHEARDRQIDNVRHLWAPGAAFVINLANEHKSTYGGRRRVGFMMLSLGGDIDVILQEPSRMLNIDIGNWLANGIGHYAELSAHERFFGAVAHSG